MPSHALHASKYSKQEFVETITPSPGKGHSSKLLLSGVNPSVLPSVVLMVRRPPWQLSTQKKLLQSLLAMTTHWQLHTAQDTLPASSRRNKGPHA